MIIYADATGAIINQTQERIYQGSNLANKIYFVAPFAPTDNVSVGFLLPNGEYKSLDLADSECELEGVTDKADNNFNVWEYLLPYSLTENYGTVTVQFCVYDAGGARIATSSTQFVVEKGVPPQLPPEPEPDVYDEILNYLTIINNSITNGHYPAKSIQPWESGLSYGYNEITVDSIGKIFYRSQKHNNTSELSVTEDWEKIIVPTKMSELKNDADYMTRSDTNNMTTIQINAHNVSTLAHADIRQSITKEIADRKAAIDYSIYLHNSSDIAHADIRALVSNIDKITEAEIDELFN